MSHDPTEPMRRSEVNRINTAVESSDEDAERARLEAEYGQVWDTKQFQEDFAEPGIATPSTEIQYTLLPKLSQDVPYVVVTRKADSVVGSLELQHNPRYYFNFTEK